MLEYVAVCSSASQCVAVCCRASQSAHLILKIFRQNPLDDQFAVHCDCRVLQRLLYCRKERVGVYMVVYEREREREREKERERASERTREREKTRETENNREKEITTEREGARTCVCVCVRA